MINTTDLHATIAKLVGIQSDAPDANDFSPAFSGDVTDRQYVYVEHFSDAPVRGRSPLGWAIRDAQYKLVAADNADPMLFDLLVDSFEKNDLLHSTGSKELQTKAAELNSAYQTLTQ